MFMEGLDARVLMAGVKFAAGLDLTFGTRGHVALDRNTFIPTTLVSGPDGSTFVAGDTLDPDPVYSVIKLDAHGNLDKHFGLHGYAPLPQAATQLAYDPAHGYLYVGTTTSGDRDYANIGLGVTRLTVHGRPDPAFGTDGSFSYLPGTAALNASRQATVEAINPLADGSVLLAVDREAAPADSLVTEQSLALLKLRPDGTPDPAYGTGGLTQVLGGTITADRDESTGLGDFTEHVRRGFFADVRTNRHGQTTALIRYEDGTVTQDVESVTYSEEATNGLFQLKARTVSSTGVEDPAAAQSWTIFSSGRDADQHVSVLYAGQNGNGARAVLQTYDESATQPYDPSTVVSYLSTATPAQRPTRQVFAPRGLVGPVQSVTASINGKFVATSANHLVRLNKKFIREPDFAVHGVATAANGDFGTSNFYPQNATIDDLGRVIAFERSPFAADDILERFA